MRIGFFLFLCLLAVAGGLGWGIWEYKQEHPASPATVVDGLKPSPVAQKPGDTTPKPPDNGTKPPDPKVTPPDPGPKVPPQPEIKSSDAGLLALVEEGQRLYREASFAAAKKKFLQALSGKLSAEDRRRIETLQQNASMFQALVDQVNPNDILPVDNRAIVYLENGGEIAGVLVKEGSDYVDIRKDSGVVGHFAQIQIKRVEKLSKDFVLAALEKEYKSKVESMPSKPTGFDYYEVAVFCVKNQLSEHITALLEEAVKRDRNVMQAATETKAKLVYNVWQYATKKGNKELAEQKKQELLAKYPDSRYAGLIRNQVASTDKPKPPPDNPPVKPPDNPPVKPPDNPPDNPPVKPPVKPPDTGGTTENPDGGGPMPKFSNPKVGSLVEKGNRAYDEGMIHLEKSFDDKTPDRDGENLKALALFKEACANYEAASDLDPNNAWLNERYQRASENRVMCFIAAKKR